MGPSAAISIDDYNGRLLVCMAGPGTGKTKNLLDRVDHLLGSNPKESIRYITFIRKIARDFEEGCVRRIGDPPPINTLHSLACRLVRNLGHSLGYKPVEFYFMDVSQDDRDDSTLFRRDLRAMVDPSPKDTQARAGLSKLKSCWRTGANPDVSTDASADPYSQLSRAYNILDWDQAVSIARSLYSNEGVRPRWMGDLKHLLIDEYQDFNIIEQQFIQDLIANATTSVVVGDEHQSIYSSRGALPVGLSDLYANTPDRTTLQDSYRCKAALAQAANTFQDTITSSPRPLRNAPVGGATTCLTFKSMKAEVAELKIYLESATSALSDDSEPKERVVCLFRSHKPLKVYFEKLRQVDVPCYTRTALSGEIAQRRRRLQRCLGLVVSPGQPFRERLLLDEFIAPTKRLHSDLIRRILEYDESPLVAFGNLPKKLTKRRAPEFDRLQELVEHLRVREAASIASFFRDEHICDHPELEEQLGSFLEMADIDQDDVEALADKLLPETAAGAESPRSVEFLTMHSSKGLTRRIVVMPGLEQAIMPGAREGEKLAEERRLFYVAITRATDEVLITLPRWRGGKHDPLAYAAPGRCVTSTFVMAAGIRTTCVP
jgi:DNA helicase-2/ATP-dependent DNA helicase PcrA